MRVWVVCRVMAGLDCVGAYMSEDEFEYDGKTYIAVDDNPDRTKEFVFGCSQCALRGQEICNLAPCIELDREDGRSVHFEVKQ
jgi:hypothetical protein